MTTTKVTISELFRSIDTAIKSGNFKEANSGIDSILAINPKDVYARAYRERIDAQMKILSEKSQTVTNASQTAAQSGPVLHNTEGGAKPGHSIPSTYGQKLTDAVAAAYKTLLREIWKDGQITPVEQERLSSMREFFAISQNDHDQIEKDVRMLCFLDGIRSSWEKGIRDFASVKKQFRINDEEEAILRPKTERLIKALGSKGVVLSLDDDKNFLLLVERLLEKRGYHSLNTTSGEEALNLLEHFTPDLVLCDIAFGQMNMNGFMFYEQFRSMDQFASVPFIFISALNQKELIKTGKKIGVDDYLTKPVDNDVLMAAVEGRIRRSREMKLASEF